MKCPFCATGVTDVKDSRPADVKGSRPVTISIRRRRKCRDCEVTFTTHEEVRDFALEKNVATSIDDMKRIRREMAKIVNFIKEAGYV